MTDSTQNTPLKTVFLLPSLAAGGAERVLITLMNGVDRTRFSPEFLCVSTKGDIGDLIDSSTPFHTLEKRSVLWSLPLLLLKLKKLKPDIIVSTAAHMNFAALALKPFFPKTRFIVRETITPSFLLEKYPYAKWLLKTLFKTLYPQADIMISPANRVFDQFRHDIGLKHQNFMLLPNPVDIQRVRKGSSFPEITKARKETVHFVACGRLEHQKGFDRLIEACSQMKHDYPWRLTIFGEGHERENLENLISQYGLASRITLPGLFKEPYVQFAQADCFLLPSRYEGLPNVVLESLACGTPVIATKESGGIDEIAANTQPDSLQIVDDMAAFLRAMESVHPTPTKSFRSSLLPQKYELENILSQFNSILGGTQK